MSEKEAFPCRHPFRKPERALLLVLIAGLLLLVTGGASIEAGTKGATAKRPPTETPVTVKEISFRMTEAKEALQLTLNHFYVPEISRIEGDNPRIILDFHPVVDFSQKDYGKIAVSGRFIRQLRSYHDRKGKKLRIVLDMNRSLNYFAQPSFVKSANLFLLEIMETAGKK